jgi:hypothetical protein
MEIIAGIVITVFVILWAVGSLAGHLFGYDFEVKK